MTLIIVLVAVVSLCVGAYLDRVYIRIRLLHAVRNRKRRANHPIELLRKKLEERK